MGILDSVRGWFTKAPDGSVPMGSMAQPDPRPMETAGAPGFSVHGGYLTSGEKNANLQGQNKYIAFDEMIRNVDVVGLSILYFMDLVSSAEWTWEPADDSAEAQEMADRVKKILTTMTTPWLRVVRRLSLFKFFGFIIHEWTAKRDKEEGWIGLLDVEARPCHTIWRWDTDDSGTVQGVWQLSPQTFREAWLPRWKLVYLVDDSITDSPDGMGLLRLAIQAAKRLQRYEQLEGYGFETDLRGNPIGRMPLAEMLSAVGKNGWTEEKRIAAEKPLRDFVENHFMRPDRGMVLDSAVYFSKDPVNAAPSVVKKWDLEIVKGGNTTQEAANVAIERLNRQLARIFGTEHIILGDGKGSFALSKDKTQLLTMRVDSCLQDIASVVDADLIGALFDLNGWDTKLKPKSTPDAVKLRDAIEAATILLTLGQAGAPLMPGDPAIDKVRGLAHLPKIPEEVKAQMEMDAALARGAQQAAIEGTKAKAKSLGGGGATSADGAGGGPTDEAGAKDKGGGTPKPKKGE